MWIFKEYGLLSLDEHKELLLIRNQEHIRKASKNSAPISLEDHLLWVKRLSTCKHYFALIIKGKIYGGLYYINDTKCIQEWGIFFSQNTPPLIPILVTYLFMEYMFKEYDEFFSEVLFDNEQALSINRYFCIEAIAQTDSFYKMYIDKKRWQEHAKHLLPIKKRAQKIVYRFERKDKYVYSKS